MPVKVSAVRKTNPHREQMIKKLKSIVERELGAKGLRQSSTEPQLLISYYGHSQDKTLLYNEYGDYWGSRERYGAYSKGGGDSVGTWWARDGSIPSYEVETIDIVEGTVHIDLVDTQTLKAVWRAQISGSVDRKNAAMELEKSLVDVFSKYPPRR